MRTLSALKIQATIRDLCLQANCLLDSSVIDLLKIQPNNIVINELLENARLARSNSLPLCQDTGMVIVFADLGQDIQIIEGSLQEAINNGVAEAYTNNGLRFSMLIDPIERENTGNNTPALIHLRSIGGDKLKIRLLIKGGGSENKSGLKMLTPAQGWAGVEKFVLETVNLAGASACPPFIVGVGLGGSFDSVAILAKEALLRPLDQIHQDSDYAKREAKLLETINQLAIGPAGFGGSPTALAVHIQIAPCHIASLPVAVNIGCHAHRHAEITL